MIKSINDIVQQEQIPFSLMYALDISRQAKIIDTKETGTYASIDYLNQREQKVRNYYNLILDEEGKFMFEYGCTVLVRS